MRNNLIVDLGLYASIDEMLTTLRNKKCSVTFRTDSLLRRHEEDIINGDEKESVHLRVLDPKDVGLVCDARPRYVWERAHKKFGLQPCPLLTASYLFLQHSDELQEDENVHVISTSEDIEGVLSVSIMHNFETWFLCVVEFGEYRRSGMHSLKKNKFAFAMP
ncbi:MAG TPA: hypothetical protein ENI56_00170 [Candidatus Kaiserbacteria bacterium]|nr:hypothetical protein [Candidatus Kaiserbacteria bacterium]